MTLQAVSLDFDGCADLIAFCPDEFRQDKQQTKQWLEQAYGCLLMGNPQEIVININGLLYELSSEALLKECPTFAMVKQKLAALVEGDQLVLYLGSNRQSDEFDQLLAWDKNQRCTAVECTKVLTKVLNLARAELAKPKDVQFKHLVRLQSLTDDADVLIENTKFMLLLQQMHAAKTASLDEDVELTFIDDRADITTRAFDFFATNPDLIPSGLNLSIVRSHIFNSYQSVKVYRSIVGTGIHLTHAQISNVYGQASETLKTNLAYSNRPQGGWPGDGDDYSAYQDCIKLATSIQQQ